MSPAMLAALTASELRPAIFLQAQFSSGPLYLWSGTGPKVWNGNTYLGMGTFGSVSAIEEGATVEAKGIVLTLSGIDPTLLADALQNIQIGLPVTLYLALFQSGGTLISDPLLSWAGRIDQPTFDISGTTATISINCESRLLEMNVSADRRYTFEDSQMDHPGDLGLQFVNALQESTVMWGATAQSSTNL